MPRFEEILLDEAALSPPRLDADPLQLETRGVTQQIHQTLLWAKCTIHKNSVAAKLRQVGRAEDAQVLENCHTQYTYAQCKGCSRVNRFPNRCDRFYCPECQPRLAADRKKAVEWWATEVRQPKHVVLTVQNVNDLNKGHVKQLRRWWTNLRRSKLAANWHGGFYSIEVTNEGKGWHLHIHALIDARWIDSFRLSEHWAKVTSGMGRIVKVKDARGKDYLAEVTKYCVKGPQLAAWTPETITTFIDAFQGVRTFGVFGSLYGARTKFAEWWHQVRNVKPICQCGCSEAWYFSESEWLERDLVPNIEAKPIPPPSRDLTIPLPLD
jgi:hypothetical protein